MCVGLVLNFSGMIGEFANPLFIGWVIDAIVDRDLNRVKELVMYWMIINGVGSILTGIQRFIFELITQKVGQSLR
jgi:ABC-type bacteriocin/lantibiotic exporter with double-glycine peptidase domain